MIAPPPTGVPLERLEIGHFSTDNRDCVDSDRGSKYRVAAFRRGGPWADWGWLHSDKQPFVQDEGFL